MNFIGKSVLLVPFKSACLCCALLLLNLNSFAQAQEEHPTPTPSVPSETVPLESPSTPPSATPTPATTINISILKGATGKGPAGYGENPKTISVGTTVKWTNEDTVPHTVTSDAGTPLAFDSGVLSSGQNFSFIFSTVGTYSYSCAVHGKQSMSGVIVVK
jgi:plastocyanin